MVHLSDYMWLCMAAPHGSASSAKWSYSSRVYYSLTDFAFEFRISKENLIGSVQLGIGSALDQVYCPSQSALAREVRP